MVLAKPVYGTGTGAGLAAEALDLDFPAAAHVVFFFCSICRCSAPLLLIRKS
jgi:hypothetical protein